MSNNNDQFDKMVNTPEWKLIAILSVPTIISMLVTNIYNVVDTAFVGFLGNSASAAVSIIFGFMSILQAIGFMYGQGGGSIAARRLGEKNYDEAGKIASTAVVSSFLTGALTGIFGLITFKWIVYWLGSSASIAPYARQYLLFILLAAPFTSASFTLNNILRYEGKAKLGMIGLITGGIVNICGDALFMFIFRLGVYGAGLSTALSQILSFTILMYMFISGKTECKLDIKNARLFDRSFFNIVFTGFPSMLRQVLNCITSILLNNVAKQYGDSAVAAMGIVSKISFFAFSVALGIGQGFQPVSAFNYGAKRYDRVRRAYRFTFLYSGLMLFIFAGLSYIFSDFLVGIMRDFDPDVIKVGGRALRLQCLAQVVMPLCMTTEMLYQSTGKRLGASILSACRGGIFFIPALIILPMLRGLSGIEEAQPLAFILSFPPALICTVIYFVKLKKLEKKELENECNQSESY